LKDHQYDDGSRPSWGFILKGIERQKVSDRIVDSSV